MEQRLLELLDLFLEENRTLNLSAFRNREDCWHGNILDSLAALELPMLQENGHCPISPPYPPQKCAGKGKQILDLGTGGGFPLLPLALCLPEQQFTGIDSTKKKIDAVGRMVDALQLTNVTLLCVRAEELGHDPQHREQYDIVTARALAPLNILLEYASPFVRPGGYILCWKSAHIEKELQDSLLARAELSCHLEEQHLYTLPKQWGERKILVFTKRGTLSGTYPRATGVPRKNPLL